MSTSTKYDRIQSLAAKRGFFWVSYEIYGGKAGFYDLGPLGVKLKNNIVELWRQMFVREHSDFVVEIETPIITPGAVFEASGHLQHFTDYAVTCKKCGRVYRADHLVEEVLGIKAEGLTEKELDEIISRHGIRCPVCGGELSEVRRYLLLFQTVVGPYSSDVAFLRPEAAQGMFVNFKRVYEMLGRKLPLGIAQIGRVARNEISPRQGIIRLREFTIMEIEFFYDPLNPQCDTLYERCSDRYLYILTAEDRARGEEKPQRFRAVEAVESGLIKSAWLGYWMCVASKFLEALGIPSERFYFEEKLPAELAHYSKQTFDQIVLVERWGKLEVSGHAYRHDYDLSGHIAKSGSDLYAIRVLKEPRTEIREIVAIDKMVILKTFGNRASEVFRALSAIGESKLKELFTAMCRESSRFLVVEGFEIPCSAFHVKKEEVKSYTEKFVPHVAEPSFGAERLLYVALEYAYTEEDGRVVLRFPPYIAPIKAAVFPLVAREPLTAIAKDVYRTLISEGIDAIYDDSGSIGKRYREADEIGIPLCITVDYDSADKRDVSVRDRDTRKQYRVPIERLIDVVRSVERGRRLEELGYPLFSSGQREI